MLFVMFNSINLNIAAESVKRIVDSVSCTICDKSSGERVRYYCGHTACKECADITQNCLLCLTPPPSDQDKFPIHDEPLTLRVKHANELRQAFEETFQIEVEKRLRISEQLKREKEVFPECIQVVHSYHNKRKSVTPFNRSREIKTSCILPGEGVKSPGSIKMDNTKSFYVEEWLNQHENELINFKRKPFSDLEVNSPQFNSTPIKTRTDRIFDELKGNALDSKPRKPFSDLEVNRSQVKSTPIKTRTDRLFDELKGNPLDSKPRKPFSEPEVNRSQVKSTPIKTRTDRLFDELKGNPLDSKPRKPFSEPEVNRSQVKSTPIKTRTDRIFDELKQNALSSRKKNKKTSVKPAHRSKNNKSRLDLFEETKVKVEWKSVDRLKREFDLYDGKNTSITNKIKLIESDKVTKQKTNVNLGKNGVIVNDSEVIIIEDSQDNPIDKDKKAWLAVLQAHENESTINTESICNSQLECKELGNFTDDIEATPGEGLINFDIQTRNPRKLSNLTTNNISHSTSCKVPFYKRGPLKECCKSCNVEEKQFANANKSKNVSVTVKTDSFTATVTVSRCSTNHLASSEKHSKNVQTDTEEKHTIGTEKSECLNHENIPNDTNPISDGRQSQDLFTDDPKETKVVKLDLKDNITVVSESSTDSELEQSTSLVISADVHRSKDDEGNNVLCELTAENITRKPAARRHSPQSSNSSDKENRDPNIMRKRRHLNDKKKSAKKSRRS